MYSANRNCDLTPRLVAQVKANLPDIQVEIGGKTLAAHVFGRELPFARVCPIGVAGPGFEVTWATVARAATYRTIVRLD